MVQTTDANRDGSRLTVIICTFTSWYSFISQAKSRSRVEQRLFDPPGSPIEPGSNRYLTANGGFDVQLELKLLNTPFE
ncbi:hypothetical protein Hanom_Chr16g01446351 [Helianthus anomalus]